MKKYLPFLLALALISAVATPLVHAQPALKIAVVDIGKVYDNHYERKEKEAELQSDQQKAEAQLQELNKEGNDLVSQYKDLVDQSKNPALTHEAQAKADTDAKAKLEEIQKKQKDVDDFKVNVQREFQQRIENFRSLLIDEITRTAADVAKRHGATLVLDKSAVSLYRANMVIYSDSAYDITDEVIKEVNKDQPQATPAAGGTTPAPGPADSTPKVSVPGLTPNQP